MKDVKHTPTLPLHTEKSKMPVLIIYDNNNMFIGYFSSELTPFLVRACNNHDALVEALEDLIIFVDAIAEEHNMGNLRDPMNESVQVTQADEALAKAEE